MQRRRVRACTAGIVACLLLATACSNDENVAIFDPLCLELTPGTPVAGPSIVARSASTSSCSFLNVELVATGVEDVLGARFTVSYPAEFARLDAIDKSGSFLGSDGTQVEVEPELPPGGQTPGTIAVVISRQNTSEGATPVPADSPDLEEGEAPDEVLVTLRFTQILGFGEGELSFTLESVEGAPTPPSTGPPVPIDGVTWVGGDLDVR